MEDPPKINPGENEFADFYIVKSFDYPKRGVSNKSELERMIKVCYDSLNKVKVNDVGYKQLFATSKSMYETCDGLYNRLYKNDIGKASIINSIVDRVIDALEGHPEINGNTAILHDKDLIEDYTDSYIIRLANLNAEPSDQAFKKLYKEYNTKFTNFLSRIKALYSELKTTELRGDEKYDFWNEFLEKNSNHLSTEARRMIRQKIPEGDQQRNQNEHRRLTQGYLFTQHR